MWGALSDEKTGLLLAVISAQKIKVTLRLTVSQSVCLGVEPHVSSCLKVTVLGLPEFAAAALRCLGVPPRRRHLV
jgi:hypothetical protein